MIYRLRLYIGVTEYTLLLWFYQNIRGKRNDSSIHVVHFVVGIPILSSKVSQCVQEEAKSSESALDEGIPEGCWERTQCRSSVRV